MTATRVTHRMAVTGVEPGLIPNELWRLHLVGSQATAMLTLPVEEAEPLALVGTHVELSVVAVEGW